MVIWCFCTYKYKWQLSPGTHTPRPHMLLERKAAPQGAPADCLSSCHASPQGAGNGKDSHPLCERLVWSSHSNSWFWGDAAHSERKDWCAPTLSAPLQTSLPGERVWLQAGTDPALLLSGFHSTLTSTHWARTVLCALSVLLMALSAGNWRMVPVDIPALPPIPNPLKIQAQQHDLVEILDKRLELWACSEQAAGLGACGDDTIIPTASTLHIPNLICKRDFQYLWLANCKASYTEKMAEINSWWIT